MQLGEYLILGTLGRGGMGIVYAAEERLSRRPAALKVLNAEVADSSRGRELFVAEMGILARLDHPNVVRLQHCCEVDGKLMMALELVNGETLRQQLKRRGRLAAPEVLNILHQMLAGVGAAHAQPEPVIHRDLKPENVMLEVGGVVKVMDFGIAKILAETNRTSTSNVGTLQYMSPEQLGGKHIDARSDLYNIGLIVYELLGGSPPFGADSTFAIVHAHCNEPPPPLPPDVLAATPARLIWAMDQMLAKAPEHRPANAGVIAHWIHELGAGQTPTDIQRSAPKPVAPEQSPPGASMAGLLGGDATVGPAQVAARGSIPGSAPIPAAPTPSASMPAALMPTGPVSGSHRASRSAPTDDEHLSNISGWSRHGVSLETVGLVDSMAHAKPKRGAGGLLLAGVLGAVVLGGAGVALLFGSSDDAPLPAAVAAVNGGASPNEQAADNDPNTTRTGPETGVSGAPPTRADPPEENPKPADAPPEPTPATDPPKQAHDRIPPIQHVCPVDANDDGVADIVTLSLDPQVLDAWDGRDGKNLWTHKPLFKSRLLCIPGSLVGLAADKEEVITVWDVATQSKAMFMETGGAGIRIDPKGGCIRLVQGGGKTRDVDPKTGKDTNACAKRTVNAGDGVPGLPTSGATRVIRSGTTYTASSASGSLRVSATKGAKQIWSQSFRHKRIKQPALLATEVLVATLGTVDDDTLVVSLDRRTGRPGFESPVPASRSYVAFFVTEQDIIVSDRDFLIALNAVTGTESWARWSLDGNKKFGIPASSGPIER